MGLDSYRARGFPTGTMKTSSRAWLIVGTVLLLSGGSMTILATGAGIGTSNHAAGVSPARPAVTPKLSKDCAVVLNFDSINTVPSGSASATSYLASYGITVQNATAGTSIIALNSNIAYGGGGFVAASLPTC
jgi:hypothetical protein